jgi:hypothetical protein
MFPLTPSNTAQTLGLGRSARLGRRATASAVIVGAAAIALLAFARTSANAAENSSRMAQEHHACAVVLGLDPSGRRYDSCIRSLDTETDCGLASSPRHPQPFPDAKLHPARIGVVVTTRQLSCIKAPLCAAHTPDQLPAPKGSAARLRRGPLGNRSGEQNRVARGSSLPRRRRHRR